MIGTESTNAIRNVYWPMSQGYLRYIKYILNLYIENYFLKQLGSVKLHTGRCNPVLRDPTWIDLILLPNLLEIYGSSCNKTEANIS